MLTIPGPVILDLNTQRDLLTAEGAAAAFQCEKLHDPLKKLFSFSQKMQFPVVSTRLHHQVMPMNTPMNSHAANGPARIICQPTTPGYQKMPSTTLRRRQEWPLDCRTDLPVEGFRHFQQFIFDLPNLNLFECPRLDRLLSESTVGVFIIVGAPIEYTVRTAVLGLLARRHKVAVVSDCLGMWDPYEGDMALRQIESKNIEWLTAAQVVERYGVIPRARTTRLLRAKSRATHSNMPAAAKKNSGVPRGAFRV